MRRNSQANGREESMEERGRYVFMRCKGRQDKLKMNKKEEDGVWYQRVRDGDGRSKKQKLVWRKIIDLKVREKGGERRRGKRWKKTENYDKMGVKRKDKKWERTHVG